MSQEPKPSCFYTKRKDRATTMVFSPWLQMFAGLDSLPSDFLLQFQDGEVG